MSSNGMILMKTCSTEKPDNHFQIHALVQSYALTMCVTEAKEIRSLEQKIFLRYHMISFFQKTKASVFTENIKSLFGCKNNGALREWKKIKVKSITK